MFWVWHKTAFDYEALILELWGGEYVFIVTSPSYTLSVTTNEICLKIIDIGWDYVKPYNCEQTNDYYWIELFMLDGNC